MTDHPTNRATPAGRRATVIGASGYVGTHLVPKLVAEGWAVCATSRDIDTLAARDWQGVTLVTADILDRSSLERAIAGADVVFYLVHCMAAGGDFATLERRGARNLLAAADAAGVGRIVYLGGLAPANPHSQHLRARLETGQILRGARCIVIEIQAAMIVGPGSAAFEVMRDLVNHLPLMVTPRWVLSRSTPIALDNLLVYLTGVATIDYDGQRIFEAAGAEVCTYEQMLRTLGDLLDRRVRIVHLPALTPRLSSYGLGLVSSVPTRIAAALIEGLAHTFIANDEALRKQIPQRLMDFRSAAAAALAWERAQPPVTRWVEGALACRDGNPRYGYYAKKTGNVAASSARIDSLWRVVLTVGRDGDYFSARGLWFLRRLTDRLLGGPAMRTPRRDEDTLEIGDRLDGWRVMGLDNPTRLSLIMTMRAPGSGLLEFSLEATATGSRVRATAYWHPAGFLGLLYWYAMLPFHGILFRSMTRTIARRAEQADAG